MRLLAWILCLLIALTSGSVKKADTDGELRSKVQEHLDTIVDEGAAILDDVIETIREDERVQGTEEFVQDMIDITGETVEKMDEVLDDARTQVEEKLSPEETMEKTEKP